MGFNLLRFYYQVLAGYTEYNPGQLPTLDIMQEVYSRLGFRLSLDHLVQATLGQEKTADGLQALSWWKQGQVEKVVEYCRQDVLITQRLYTFGRDQGYLLFRNKARDLVRLPVQW